MTTVWSLPFALQLREAIEVGFPATAALAAVALIGYLFGQRTRREKSSELDMQHHQQLDRATGVARQFETLAHSLRQDLASHHSQLTQFKRRLNEARENGDSQSWHSLCTEAELILEPTDQLAQRLSLAYDAIRQQSEALETLTQGRTDPLTGVGNGRALGEKIDFLLAAAQRGGAEFSVALVSLDRQLGAVIDNRHSVDKSRLPEVARLITSCMRNSDFVARYGDDEFVVLMSQTRLAGAHVFAARLQTLVAERTSTTVSCGIAEYRERDGEQSLVARAESALYSAKAAGTNRLFVNTGSQIREQRPSGRRGTADCEKANGADSSSRQTPPLTLPTLDLPDVGQCQSGGLAIGL